jgi:hypothetical protein
LLVALTAFLCKLVSECLLISYSPPQQREGRIRDLVLLLRHQRKRNTIVNSRTSGKNHTTGYSQVRWEMIWRFALCVIDCKHIWRLKKVSKFFVGGRSCGRKRCVTVCGRFMSPARETQSMQEIFLFLKFLLNVYYKLHTYFKGSNTTMVHLFHLIYKYIFQV